MNKKEIPSELNNHDIITCGCFAYSFYICVIYFNVILFVITALLWQWYINERVKR